MTFKSFSSLFGILLFVISGSVFAAKQDARSADYPYIRDYPAGGEFVVTPLRGKITSLIYQDGQGNYVFQTFETVWFEERDDDGSRKRIYNRLVYKVSPTGEVLGVFELKDKDGLKFFSGYQKDDSGDYRLPQINIAGEGAYTDWLTTGDATVHRIPLSAGVMNREQFRQYYKKAKAVFIPEYSKTATAITADGRWEYVALDFLPARYEDGEQFETKREWGTAFSKENSLSGHDYFSFGKPPQTVDGLTFERFEKGRKIRAPLINIMGYPSYQMGVGFFTLKLADRDFRFASDEIKLMDRDSYTLDIGIHGNGRFVFVDKAYIVRLKAN